MTALRPQPRIMTIIRKLCNSPNGNVGNSLRLFINSLTIKKKTHLTNKVGNKSVTKVAFIAVCKAGFQVQKYYYFLLFQNDEAFYFSYQFLRRFLSKPHVVQSSGSKSVLS
jgi:hypothetical protein